MIIHLMNKDILIPTSLLTNFKASRKHLVIKPLGSKAALNQKDLTPPCGDRRSQSLPPRQTSDQIMSDDKSDEGRGIFDIELRQHIFPV